MSVDISVVVPTFRRRAQLAEALRSVLSQEGVNIEVLVIDDSPEGSARGVVASMADRRVTYCKRPVASGGNPALVRNDGWPRARGRFVHFLDDDDHVAPGAYRDIVAAFAAHPDRGVVFGRVEPFGDDPKVLERKRRGFAGSARRARMFQRLGSPLCLVANQLYSTPTVLVNSACVIRREHVGALGGYDPQIMVVEDLEFYIRAIRAFGFVYLDRIIARYRTGAPSITHDLQDDRPIAAAYKAIHAKYRAMYGVAELLALKVLAKSLIQWL